MKKGILYLIPSLIGDSPVNHSIPDYNHEIIRKLNHFIVEEIRSARRFLRKTSPTLPIDDLNFLLFNEHTNPDEIPFFLEPLMQGHDVGLLSEAGLPCVADPGATILRSAHSAGIRIIPLVGPSSLMLALMSSGFNGQNFSFSGYLPVEKKLRMKRIKELERNIMTMDQTQIFIEAPYRNIQVFRAVLETCHDNTLLCLATDLTASSESIAVDTVKNWKGKHPDMEKRPTVFLLYH
jgi:16S rRNA (cytidine1402-2'-O)-methyltransferase